MDMSKYVKMYVSESQDRLQRMDGLLLALEKNGADRAAIDTLFREAHSIKGMSASMAYEELAKISHRIEDYLDQFRGGKGALERRGVDLLFEGVDLLRRSVDEIAAGRPPSLVAEPYVAKVASLILSGPQAGPAPPAQSRAVSVPSTLRQAQGSGQALSVSEEGAPSPAGGSNSFAVDLTIAADAPLPSARAYITLRRVRDLGELIRSAPPIGEVQAGKFSGGLSMLIATSRSAAEVQAFLASLPDVASVIVRPAEVDPGVQPEAPIEPPDRGAAFAPALSLPKGEVPPSAVSLRGGLRLGESSGSERPASGVEPVLAPRSQGVVDAPPSSSPPAPPSSGGGSRPAAMMRVETRLLDDLMDQVGELVTANGGLLEQSRGIESPGLHESIGRLESLVKGLQQQAMKLRMMPLEMIADRFPRAVRDLARKRGKELAFEILGKEIELDRAILEELPDPILHILRNCIDHGIEPPEERVRNGKTPAGTIRLEASKERESVVIRVSDDGRGMDPAALRRLALERGVITREQHDTLPDAEALGLITLPGFSTAREVSDVSGRGVGMDVVKTAVESLRGNLLIESIVGRGSTITLKLPLTLAVVRVLLIEVGRERYAIPVSSVEQILEILPGEIQRSQGQEMIARDGSLVPLLQLGRMLGCPAGVPGPSLLVALCEMRGRLVGLVVERFIGYREVVVKSLGKALKGLRGFAGVTILGDGSTVLILDLNTL